MGRSVKVQAIPLLKGDLGGSNAYIILAIDDLTLPASTTAAPLGCPF